MSAQSEMSTWFSPETKAKMSAFQKRLHDPDDEIGKMFSSEAIRAGSQRIEDAINVATVNNGHGVWIRSNHKTPSPRS